MASNTIKNSPLHILSLNVRGLGKGAKRSSLFHWLGKHHDIHNKILFLQETHVTKSQEYKWKKNWRGKMIFANGTSKSRGVAILLPKNMEFQIISQTLDPGGRYIALKIEIEHITYSLINGYAPTADKLEEQMVWLESIVEILEELGDTRIIFGGDINDGLTNLDKFNGREEWKESRYVLGWKEACQEYQLVDIWRILNPLTHKYTWKQGTCKKNLRRSRLDFWLISSGVMYSVNNTAIVPGYGSDHSLITLSLYKQDNVKQGPSFWKFNNSLLRDKVYIDKTRDSIKELKVKYREIGDKGLKWDVIKMELRSGAISYSKFLAKNKRNLMKELMEKQIKLENEIASDPSDEIINQSRMVKEELEQINAEKARGAMMRSKADWVEFGEKNTSYFLKLETRNKQVKNITKLIDDNEKEITDQNDILQEELDFYRKLYTQPKDANNREEIKQFFLNEDTPKISEENKTLCDSDISLEEIGRALKELKNGKSPGSDGFPPDFYKFFWSDLKVLVFESLMFAVDKGELSIDQRRGVISLIPKKDKDVRRLKNWRPISLLNTDYKILTKTLASRLKQVLPTVIHPDQVAYLKERYIGQNIRTIVDIMEYTEEKNIEGLIAFLDFEKAFDSIDWRVLDDALKCFNIGQGFRNWVKRVYANTTSCVTNCGFSSENFKITRGVRQGCPLSAYLFIAVVEILAIKIRKDKDIEGINIGNSVVKVVQMADDTTSFLKDSKSLEVLLETLDKFHSYAGLKLNLSKSEVLWLGSKKNSNESPLGLRKVKGVKALGIYFSYDAKAVLEKNFTEKLKELKTLLAIWGQRDLSVLGRIAIFKSLAFSKVIYQCSNLAVPDSIIKELNQIAFDFIWQGKPDKVNRTTVIADYEEGGLKMLDVECFINAQKVMWVKRLLAKKDEGSWKIYPQRLLSKILHNHSFQCNFNLKQIKFQIQPFYKQLFEAWNKIKECPEDDPFKVRREVLWFNKLITTGGKKGKLICYKDWYKSGIVFIHDIVNEDGNIKSIEELETEFNIQISPMDYNSLITSIPVKWKRILKKMRIPVQAISNKEQPYLVCSGRLTALGILTNKDVYWELVRKKQTVPICIHKWCNLFNISTEEWKIIFKPYMAIKEVRTKAFQFKVLNNLLPCNLYLKRIGKSDTDKCPKCNMLDDQMHYLVECAEVASIWSHLSRWWKGLTNQNIAFTGRDIIIGLQNRPIKIAMKTQLDEILLAVKWKIYANKQMGEDLGFYQILCSIRNMISIQNLIAIRRDKGDKHDSIWGEIESYLT